MNQIEIWFGIITRQAIRRGTFVSVNHLVDRIRTYVQHWNADAEPFVWTATADEILAKVRAYPATLQTRAPLTRPRPARSVAAYDELLTLRSYQSSCPPPVRCCESPSYPPCKQSRPTNKSKGNHREPR